MRVSSEIVRLIGTTRALTHVRAHAHEYPQMYVHVYLPSIFLQLCLTFDGKRIKHLNI